MSAISTGHGAEDSEALMKEVSEEDGEHRLVKVHGHGFLYIGIVQPDPGLLYLGQVPAFYDHFAGWRSIEIKIPGASHRWRRLGTQVPRMGTASHKMAQLCPSKLPNMLWDFICENMWQFEPSHCEAAAKMFLALPQWLAPWHGWPCLTSFPASEDSVKLSSQGQCSFWWLL